INTAHYSGLRVGIYQLLGFSLFIGLWELVSRTGLISELFLPAPSSVVVSLVDLANSGSLWTNVLITLWEGLAGFVLGVMVGAVSGFFIGLSSFAITVTNPILTMLNSLPRIALAPLFVLWFG